MVATSIKVQGETKRALDALQAELTTALGRKVTLQELAGVLAELGLRESDRVLAAFEDRPRKLNAAQLRRLGARTIDFPVPTDAADLDDLIYGFPHGLGEPATPGARRLRRRMDEAKKRRRRKP